MAIRALEGQVAVITGAGSGMGESFARRLAADGARVVVNDINAEAAARVAEDIGGEAAVFDVIDPSAFDAAIDRAVARYGRIDIVINNAGIAPPWDQAKFDINVANQMKRLEGRVAELEPTDYLVDLTNEQWDRMIRIHLYGAFYGTRAAVRHMVPARTGAVVNISSVLGLRPSPGAAHYSAAKAAIIALTKAAAQEVAPFGVRINAVCPGWVDTPLLTPFGDIAKAVITSQIPAGRLASADELAELIRFLAGPESSYCTGDVFPASGGFV